MRFHQLLTSRLASVDFLSSLAQSEIADRLSVLVLLFVCVVGFFILPHLVKRNLHQKTVTTVSVISLALLVLAMSWRWGDPTFVEYGKVLWYGWGDKFALIVLALALFLAYLLSVHRQSEHSFDRLTVLKLANLGSYVILFCFYLPSAIQPFKGIIDLYHARYVLNDFLIFSSGKMPFSEITPQYAGFLGWPLKLISFLPDDFIVNSALAWVNFLTVIEIALIAYVTRKALNIRFWGLALLIPVSTIYIKVQPNIHSIEEATYRRAWGGIAQHMSIIPARSFLPIVLLVLVCEKSKIQKTGNQVFLHLAIGVVMFLTGFNNFEFGVPAAIAALMVLILGYKTFELQPRDFLQIIAGFILSFGFIFLVYKTNGSTISLTNWLSMVKAHGVDGFMNLEMPFFGLWTFFYSVLGAGSIIGANHLFREINRSSSDESDIFSVAVLTFGGLWGSGTLLYFTGRSLAPEITPYLIPLTLCLVGLTGMLRPRLRGFMVDKSRDRAIPQIVFAPLFCLLLIPVVSLTQAPNPSFEWLRMAGTGDQWSSRAISRLEKYQRLIELRDERPDFSFVYMGNDGPTISLLSGVENGLGIILLKDLIINSEIEELGCRPATNSGADFALVPKVDWGLAEPPCPGFVLFEPEEDSPFLFFRIPSKVSS